MKIVRATADEAADYVECSDRPLYGFVMVSNQSCPIEILDRADVYRYEVRAPQGYRFTGDDVSGLVCVDLADLKERLSHECLEQEADNG